ncbi:MAG: hypothetical protein E6Q97_36185 [Desulfurellales bacterium]|nr:MAG: hypothetical protein E6Q97_36185 [Desulfurellales bacterium]
MILTKYRFPVGTEVRRTLGLWGQNLTKLANLPVSVGELFYPEDYDVSLGASGAMTYTLTKLRSSRFFQVGKMVWVQIGVDGTTGGVAAAGINVTLPIPARQDGTADLLAPLSCWVTDGGAVLAGVAYLTLQQKILITRYDGANFGLGAGRNFSIAGWYESV